jgi:poly-gamma-glutamate synthesis protein (capsule biosynthesis protein)
MNVERDRKILSFIMVATGVLIFVLVIGIVIFSLPDTTGTYDPSQVETTGITPETEKPTEETDVTFRTDDETKTEAAGIIQASTEISVEPVRLHLIAYGDNLLHKGISEYSQLPDGSYDFSSIYSDISATVSAADIAIVNQEVPVGGVELGISGYPNFNAPHEAVNALAGAGFDVLTLATNHMLDKGADGVISTLNYIRQTFPDILTTGAYLSAEEREIVPVTEVSGIRVAFLNYTYGLNGNDSARVFINVIQDDLILADVARAREQADYVVVAMHWGEENQTTPTDEQQRLARLLADAGVDLVIGTHPHVVQPVEVLTGADGHQTIVYYSLGNLVSLQHAAGNMLGGVAEVTATFVDGVLQDSSYEYSFVVTQWDENHAGSHVYPWESYTPELAAVHGITQFDASFSYEALSQMIEQALQ